jgi:Bacterial Ig domain
MVNGCSRRQQSVLFIAGALAALFIVSGSSDASTKINVTSPTNGSIVLGSVTIVIAISPGVSWANIYIDASYFTSSPPFINTWDSTSVGNGYHTISVVAYSSSNSVVGSSSATVYVRNPLVSNITVTAPTKGSNVSGFVTIVSAVSSQVSWANVYIDGGYLTSSPPYTVAWNSTSVGNGGHTITVTAYGRNSAVVGSSSVTVNVNNGPATYYVSSSLGSDSNTGTDTSHPWQTVSKAAGVLSSLHPGDRLLFNGGDVWSETMTFGDTPQHAVVGSAAAPVYVGRYGTGRPVFDENNMNGYCFKAVYPSYAVRYLTLDNFECKHATTAGVTFQTQGGNIPGITVRNFYIHNTGQGCSSSNGACIGTDDGKYANQLDFQDSGFSAGSGAVNNDGVNFVNNIVQWTGGHNCLEVHFDTGPVLVQGNMVGPGCVHGGVDLKGAGSLGNQATIKGNTCDGGQSSGLVGSAGTPCFYTENTVNPNTNMLWQSNVAWDTYVGLQICPGGIPSGYTAGGSYKVYNNTFYALANNSGFTLAYFGSPTCDGPNGGTLTPYTLDVRNNIFDGGPSNAYTLAVVSTAAYLTCTEDYNNIGGSQGNMAYGSCGGNTQLAPHDQNSVNPLYVDAGDGNFRLQLGSPDIGAGVAGLTAGDINIGAY